MIDSTNSTTTLLLADATYTGTWFSITGFNSISIIATTDVAGALWADFSTDGITQSRNIQLNDGVSAVVGIHSLIPVAKYFRIRLINGSTNQGSMDIQVIYSTQPRIALPTSRTGQTINNYSDVLNTRNLSDYHNEVALGKHTGQALWNKFGYNNDLDVGTEVIASWGGTFTPLTTALTLSIVSTSASDDDGGVGANSITLYGVNASRESVVEVITLNGTTPVITTSTWLGINRAAIYVSGTSKVNVGTINILDSEAVQQAQIPATEGTSQQLIYFTPVNSTSLMNWLLLKAYKLNGSSPKVIFKVWVYSAVNNSKYLVFTYNMDTQIEHHIQLNPPEPFVVSESSVMWIEATSDNANSLVSGRFSLIEYADF